ncbi:MAG: glucose-6-phosphate dehydrogenase [Vicinamibacterales bacterium]
MSDQRPASSAEPAGPAVLVIFGAAGDLTRRLLAPALYNLAVDGLLPDAFAIVGFARTDVSVDELRRRLAEGIAEARSDAPDAAVVEWLTSRVSYIKASFDDDEAYGELATQLDQLARERGTGGNVLYYLATGPDFFAPVVERLAARGLLEEADGHWRRVIVEKPFGEDLDSARALNRRLTAAADESQIYRIDHYLGKETVQNILVFRFGNGIFEPIWNRRYIDHVQITVAETVGVEGRGGYYDQAGALRDMIPNHLFQLLTLIAMEPPASFAAPSFHAEQVKVLEAVPPPSREDCLRHVVRAQYEGYRAEPRVAGGSTTETYVALQLAVDNWRWAGVPFYLRTGKRLAVRKTEVVIQFRQAPLRLFERASAEPPVPNRLLLSISPEESISLRFGAKVPGEVMATRPVKMRFCYDDYFGTPKKTGYETLLYDALIGDASLFKRADVIEAGWSIVDPILKAWEGSGAGLAAYAPGTAGPSEADALLADDGRRWRALE